MEIKPEDVKFRVAKVDFTRVDPVLGGFYLVVPDFEPNGAYNEALENELILDIKDLARDSVHVEDFNALANLINEYLEKTASGEWDDEIVKMIESATNCTEPERNGARLLYAAYRDEYYDGRFDIFLDKFKSYFNPPRLADLPTQRRDFAWCEWHDADWYNSHKLGEPGAEDDMPYEDDIYPPFAEQVAEMERREKERKRQDEMRRREEEDDDEDDDD